jgi:O-antigen ligase
LWDTLDDDGALSVDRSWCRSVDAASRERLVVPIRPTRVAALGIERVALPQPGRFGATIPLERLRKLGVNPFYMANMSIARSGNPLLVGQGTSPHRAKSSVRADGGAKNEVANTKQDSAPVRVDEPRWNLAFVAILGYLLVEYSRLPEMYPILKPFHLGKVLVALSVVGLFVSPGVRADRRSARVVDLGMLAFLFGVFWTALFAHSSQLAFAGFTEALTWAVTYYLISRIVVSSGRLRTFVFLLLLLNFKLAQFVVRYYFLEISWGRDAKYLATYGVGAGSTDFFGNSADLGLAMVVAWALAGSLLFGESKKLARLGLWASFIASFGAILLCGSRGAVVGAAGVALAAWLKNPKRIAGVVTLVFFVLGTYYFLPQGNKDKMRSAWDWKSDPTAFHRTVLWKAGLQMFEEHPLFGVGLGNFGRVYSEDYSSEDPNAGRGNSGAEWVPHSIYVQALSETGLAGSVPLVALWVLFFRLNSRTRRHLETLGHERRTFDYRLSIGLDLAMVGYLVSGAFIAVLYYPHLWILLGLSVGLHVACHRKQPALELAESRGQQRRFALAAS